MKRMVNKIAIFTLLLFGVIQISFGQHEEKNWDDLYPKAPNAEGLIKYIEYPVDKSTGTVNVTIPLHTIKAKEFELPISLDYHTGGIQLTQMATSVGLGWVLNAGGVISRTVKGEYPDEEPYGYLKCSKIPDTKDKVLDIHNSPLVGSTNCLNRTEEFQYWDMEPDMFYFKAEGLSGSFIHDYNGNIHLIPEQDLIVENLDPTHFSEWKIIRPDGIQYFFKDKEKSRVQYAAWDGTLWCTVLSDKTTSSWLLNKIVTPTEDTIQFIYSSEYELIDDMIHAKEQNKVDDPNLVVGPYRSKVTTFQYTRPLKKIISDSEIIEFEYDSNSREDLKSNNGHALKYVKVYNNHNKQPIKGFELLTTYFEGNTNDSDYSDVPDYSFKRLRLDKVKIFDVGNLLIGDYELGYNEYNKFGSGGSYIASYPPRLSKAADHWGYYNGHDENIQLVPSFIVSRAAGTEVKAGANRSVDAYSKKAFILDKIKYPTGGVAKFYYDSDSAYYSELNTTTKKYQTTYRPAGSLVIKKTIYDPLDGPTIQKEYQYDSGLLALGGPEHQVFNFEYSRGLSAVIWGLCYWYQSFLHTLVLSDPINNDLGIFNSVKHYGVKEIEVGNGYTYYQFEPDAGYMMDLDGTTLYYGAFLEDFPRCVVKPFINNNQPTKISYFDEAGTKKRETTNYYKTYYREIIDEDDFEAVKETYGKTHLFYTPYSIFTGFTFKDSTITEEYVDGNVIQRNTNYCYDQLIYNYEDNGYVLLQNNEPLPKYHFLTTESTVDSKGNLIMNQFKYPQDYNSYFSTLNNNHITAKPIDKRTYVGSKLISGTQTNFNDNGQPIELYNFESSVNDIVFNASQPFTFTKKQTISYTTDKNANKIDVIDNLKTYYIWAYNNQYPVVRIVSSDGSIDIEQLQSNVDAILLSGTDEKQDVDSDIYNLTNAVENLIGNSDMVTYYTYKPAVGITSQTNPNGVTTYYKYDNSGRLATVKNNDGELLEKYDYHYAN